MNEWKIEKAKQAEPNVILLYHCDCNLLIGEFVKLDNGRILCNGSSRKCHSCEKDIPKEIMMQIELLLSK